MAEIDPAHRGELVRVLGLIANGAVGAPFAPSQLPDTHFTRFVIIDDDQGDGELPALLAWESNHDQREEPYLRACAAAVPQLDAIFGCCRGYPDGGATGDVEGWLAWIRARSLRSAAFYTGYRGVSKQRVDNDHAVHQAIRATLDAPGARAALSALPQPDMIRAAIATTVARAQPALQLDPQADQTSRWQITKLLAIAVVVLLLPILVVAVPLWYWQLRKHEESDPRPDGASRPVHDDAHYQDDEDVYAQNQLTHLVDIKPGWFRLVTAWAVLTGIDILASCVYIDGELGGITSIHFARWVILLDKRESSDIPAGSHRRHRLLFFSNYDGSWESYLGEFVDRASSGLTAVWSNTVDFPYTQKLTQLGSRDEEAFKQWTRDHQIRTQVWWTGVPMSSVQNVRDDLDIRASLARAQDPEEATSWLMRL
nr:hypothetical protein [Kofleriaceae bacterium]